MKGKRRPLGTVTRGTTAPNRLRRVDRWLAVALAPLLRSADAPLVVDLGFGASPITTVELFVRLRARFPSVRITGLEIDPARVQEAQPYSREGLTFAPGGFEVPTPPPLVIRAFNVLRQYTEAEAWASWDRLRGRLAPGGILVEGTCDEIGRRAAWVTLDAAGPRTLTFSTHLPTLDRPSVLAERLPKVLIHRNVPGENIHAFLTDFDRAWEAAARGFGLRHRWTAAVAALSADWPVHRHPPLGGPTRWRLGEITLNWDAVSIGIMARAPQRGLKT